MDRRPLVRPTPKLTVLDLFSGIGGFSLGLESTGGFRTIAFCESNGYAACVLNKHWPCVPVFDDIRTFTSASLTEKNIPFPDVICGGFPCQDLSFAGKGVGLAGTRSGLWFEMLRVITEVQPKYVIIENVPALRSRGLDELLRSLASIGYDAEWHCIPAAAVGAPHRRDRIWIMAYPSGSGCFWRCPVADAKQGSSAHIPLARRLSASGSYGSAGPIAQDVRARTEGPLICYANSTGLQVRQRRSTPVVITRSDWWHAEPDVGRVANGVPDRVDRIVCLGNAVVPQIVALIGQAILARNRPGYNPIREAPNMQRRVLVQPDPLRSSLQEIAEAEQYFSDVTDNVYVAPLKGSIITWSDPTWGERIHNYVRMTGYPCSLFIAGDGRVVGTWIMGNSYKVSNGLYGGYPDTYLKRIKALFPEKQSVLHIFSGMVDQTIMSGDTVDINPEYNPTYVDDAQRLEHVPLECYDLVMADPPYSNDDAMRYGTTMVKRNVVVQALQRVRTGTHVVWLDQVLPMYRKDAWKIVACIGMVKSTNHRFRMITIFERL